MNPARELKKIANILAKFEKKAQGAVKLSEIKRAKELLEKLKPYSKMFKELSHDTGEMREELIGAALDQGKIDQGTSKWMDELDRLWISKIEKAVAGEADVDPFSMYDDALGYFNGTFDVDI